MGDLLLDFQELALQCLRLIADLRDPRIPHLFEHRSRDLYQARRWLGRGEQQFELALDVGTPHALAVAGAALLGAVVVWMTCAAALGPARSQSATAIIARDKTAEGEVLIYVRTPGLARFAIQPVLDRLIGLETDQRFMLAFAQGDIPRRMLDIARVKRLIEQPGDGFRAHLAAAIFGEERMILQEAHRVRLQLEPPAGEAFERFGNDGRRRFIALQQLAAARHAGEAVADRRLERPAAIEQPGTHSVDRLLRVFAPGVLGDSGEEILDQLRIRIITELDGGRLQNAACVGDGGPQRKMRFEAARQARDVIDDDDRAALLVLRKMRQHELHAWAAG